jgi:DUF1009 family protein
MANEPVNQEPLAIICGSGSLPFAVADAALRQGRPVVLFPLHGFTDPHRVAIYPHHWLRLGQFGRFCRIARKQGCRDLVLIGSVVRPSLWQIRIDFGTLRVLPRILRMLRGGDDHLLSIMTKGLEERGFRVIGAQEIAPEILVPQGAVGRFEPTDREQRDIVRGLAVLRAMGPFDIGQAVVVADYRVLAVEAADGTDGMLAHVAALRRSGRIRVSGGVLVKAPKPTQDRRVDLPTIGPQTIEGAARAGLAGIAVVAGEALMAQAERIQQCADRERIFLVGVRDDPGKQ